MHRVWFCRRSGPGALEQLLPSGTGALWHGPGGICLLGLGLLVSCAAGRRVCPDAAWLAVLGLLVSCAGGARVGPDAAWLEVLGLLDCCAGGARVCPDAAGLVVLGLLGSCVGGPSVCPDAALLEVLGLLGSCAGGPRVCPDAAGLVVLGPASSELTPEEVPRPAQLSHSQLSVLFLKLEQRLCVPSAAQEQHRKSSQGLGKDKSSWL